MTQRERKMATLLGTGIVLVVGLGGLFVFLNAIFNSDKVIEGLNSQIADNQNKIEAVIKNRPVLMRWQQLSNAMAEEKGFKPGNIEVTRRSYREYLENLMRDHGLIIDLFPEAQADAKAQIIHPGKPGKQSIYTGLNFTVRAKARLSNVVAFLHDFQRKPYMHRIKSMIIEKSSSAKDGDLLSLTMSFENIIILEADQLKRKAAAPEPRFMAVDTAMALRKAVPGLGLFVWWMSPQGAYAQPLNPPFNVREYSDIATKNFFIGPVAPKTITKDPKTPKDKGSFGTAARDEIINMMRFTRLVSMTTNEEGLEEAHLWDMYNNKKSRLRVTSAFKTFGLVQTAQATQIIQGVVQKIESHDVIFRIVLKAYDSANSKWWRYPNDENYYTLHEEDYVKLEKAGKIKASEKGSVFLVNQPYWEKLTAKGSGKVEVAPDGKTFRFLKGVVLRGEVVDSDSFIVVLKLNGPPPKAAHPPSIAGTRVYPDSTIYHVNFKHYDDMVGPSKGAAGGKSAKGPGGGKGGKGPGGGKGAGGTVPLTGDKAEIDHVYAVQASYWDSLIAQKIVKSFGSTFSFYHETVCGDIISKTDDLIVFRTYEQYSKCAADTDRGLKERYHEGFCVLRVANFVQDALYEPLPESRVKEFLR